MTLWKKMKAGNVKEDFSLRRVSCFLSVAGL